eukprot:m.33141 g.33141  ORF g.33141 m.33141 type:complete len:791 (-) comp16766_c0_seq1:275-2647(-)
MMDDEPRNLLEEYGDFERKPSPGMAELESKHFRNRKRGLCVTIKEEAKSFVELTGITDINRVMPITTWIRQYSRSKAVSDFIAGLTVGLMLIPQGMAYATIAGLPAIYGLYGGFMGLFVYALMGTSKDITNGPTALMSLIVVHGLPHLPHPPHDETTNTTMYNPCHDVANLNSTYCCQDGEDFLCTPVNMAIALSLATGIIQIGLGLLNFGGLIDFIAFPVLNGFTTAAAVKIFSSQVKHIFGLSNIDGSTFVSTWTGIFTNMPSMRWQDLVISISSLLLTYALEKVKARYTVSKNDSKKDYFLWLAGTARNAIIVVVGIIVSVIVSKATGDDKTFNLIRDIPRGLPEVKNPFADLDQDEFVSVWSYSFVTALLGYLECIAIGKAFAAKGGYELDQTQELRAIGVSNVVNSFFQGYPITGSFSRTAVNAASNSRTPLSGLMCAFVVIVSLVGLTDVFFFIPKASLAAMIIMSVVRMIDIAAVRRISKVSKYDLFIWCWVFFICVFWNLEYGIGSGIILSSLFSSWKVRTQYLERLERDDDFGQWMPDPKYTTTGLEQHWGPLFVADVFLKAPNEILVLKVTGSIEFAMASKFRDRMRVIAKYFRDCEHTKTVILDMSAVSHIDYTGLMAFRDILEDFKPAVRNYIVNRTQIKKNCKGISLSLARLQPAVLIALKYTDVMGHHVPGTNIQKGIWRLRVHRSVDLAVSSAEHRNADVEEFYPYPWLAPKEKPYKLIEGTMLEGRDDRQWIVSEIGKEKKKTWTRVPKGLAAFRFTNLTKIQQLVLEGNDTSC